MIHSLASLARLHQQRHAWIASNKFLCTFCLTYCNYDVTAMTEGDFFYILLPAKENEHRLCTRILHRLYCT